MSFVRHREIPKVFISVLLGVLILCAVFSSSERSQAIRNPASPAPAALGRSEGAGEAGRDGRSSGSSSSTVRISPGNTIQNLVNANPAGMTFLLQAGVYRMQMISPKDGDIFTGESGAILNGSQLLSRFSHDIVNGISYWVAPGPSHPGQIHGNCESTHPLCGYSEDVFIDNQPL